MNLTTIKNKMEKSKTTKKIVAYAKQNDIKLKIILLIVICSFMIIRGIMLQPETLKNKAEISRLKEEIAYEQSRQQEVEDMRQNIETDEYIERIARDKLGMMKQNEKVFVDVSATE